MRNAKGQFVAKKKHPFTVLHYFLMLGAYFIGGLIIGVLSNHL